MQQTIAFQVVRFRTLLVALGNAAVTWVVLIIAPLGLMAVITCTALVFIASLGLGYACDYAYGLLSSEERAALFGETRRQAQDRRPAVVEEQQKLPRA